MILWVEPFCLPPNRKDARHRASIKEKVIEVSRKLDRDKELVAEHMNFLLEVLRQVRQRKPPKMLSKWQLRRSLQAYNN